MTVSTCRALQIICKVTNKFAIQADDNIEGARAIEAVVLHECIGDGPMVTMKRG